MAAQHTLEEVAAGLRAPDVATRLRTVQILKDANYPEAAGPLAAAIADKDDRVKLAAIDAERALFTTRAISTRKMVGYVLEVRTPESGREASAEQQLALSARVVPPEVIAGLAGAMRDANPRVRLEAMSLFGALAPLGGQAAADAMRSSMSWTIEALRRGNRAEQAAAAAAGGRALEDCGTGAALTAESMCVQFGNALVNTLNNRDRQVHRAAMLALGQLRYPDGARALEDQLSFYQRGPDAKAALEGLAGIGHQTSADIFKRHLGDADPDFRRLAIEGLARAGDRMDLPQLEQMAQSERSNEVRLALHYAMLALGSPGKLDEMVAAVRVSTLRPHAIVYLLDLSPRMAATLAESLHDQNAGTRMLVADVLGFSGDANVIPQLDAAAKDPDAATARAAQRAIDRIKLNRASEVAPHRP